MERKYFVIFCCIYLFIIPFLSIFGFLSDVVLGLLYYMVIRLD